MLNLGDFTTAETIYVPLATYDSVGASVTLTGLALADIKIYKNGSVTERTSTAGFALLDTDGIDFDSKTGIHGFSIDLSDNTDTGFYVDEAQYWIVIDSVTVDSQTVRALYYFTIGRNATVDQVDTLGDDVEDQIAAIADTNTAGIPVEAEADNYSSSIKSVSKVGTQAGTYAYTEADDGTHHVMTHATNAIDIIYQFDVTGSRVATGITFKGYLTGSTNSITVQAYDYVGTAWETRGTIVGTASTTDRLRTFKLLEKHTGTSGSDVGKCLIRFVCSAQTSPVLNTGELAVIGAPLTQSAGYDDGAIWIDSAGTAASVDYVNGTADNPCPWANAKTINTSLGLNRFRIKNGNTLTLDATVDNMTFIGEAWTLALGSQSAANAHFEGATVSGIATGTTPPTFKDCVINAVTLPPCVLDRCGVVGTVTGGSAGQYKFNQCFCADDNDDPAVFSFSGLSTTTGINNHGWTGPSTWTLDSDCELMHDVLAGGVTLITTGGASVSVRGIVDTIAFILSNAGLVNFTGVTGEITVSGTATSTVNLYGVASTISDSSSGTDVTNQTLGIRGFIAPNSYYVDPSRVDDSGNGKSWPTAKKTLAAAIALVSAGDVVNLAGGTHTVATGTTVTVPTGVSLIGQGSMITTVTGDPSGAGNAVLETEGKAFIQDMYINAITAGVSVMLEPATSYCDVTIRGCYLKGATSAVLVKAALSGVHNLLIEDSTFDTTASNGLSSIQEVNTVTRRCRFIGNNEGIEALTTTNDASYMLSDCSFEGMSATSGEKLLSFSAGSSGHMYVVLDRVQFNTDVGTSLYTNETSTGDVKIFNINSNVNDTVTDINGTAIIDCIGTIVDSSINDSNNTVQSNLQEIQDVAITPGSTKIALNWGGFFNNWGSYDSFSLGDLSNRGAIIKGTAINTGGTVDCVINSGDTNDDYYNGCLIVIASGTGSGQARYIADYNGTSKLVTFDRPLIVATDATSAVKIYGLMASDVQSIIDKLPSASANIAGEGTSVKNLDQVYADVVYTGAATSTGTTTTIKDTSLPSTTNDYYKHMVVRMLTGNNAGRSAKITAYANATKQLTFDPPVLTATASAETFDIVYGPGTDADGTKLHDTQDSTWANNLKNSAGSMKVSTATGGTVTTLVDTSLTAADDTYNGRIVVFLSGTLDGQTASISDYDLGTTTLTISQVTTAPTTESYIII